MDDSTDTSYITDDEDLKLSSLEYQALQLYDQLLQITLEYYYLESLNESPQVVDDTSMVSTEDLDAARVELLYAKALYTLRNNMEESMIVANPMIQSVHGGKPNSIDRDLKTLLKSRDEMSLTQTLTCSKVLRAREALLKVQLEHHTVMKMNVELARAMIDLTGEIADVRIEDVRDPKITQQINDLEKNVKFNRSKWRLMRGIVSGIIAGSGVDWVGDEQLQSLVLDAEDDEYQ